MLDPSQCTMADGVAVEVFDEAHVAEGAGAAASFLHPLDISCVGAIINS